MESSAPKRPRKTRRSQQSSPQIRELDTIPTTHQKSSAQSRGADLGAYDLSQIATSPASRPVREMSEEPGDRVVDQRIFRLEPTPELTAESKTATWSESDSVVRRSSPVLGETPRSIWDFGPEEDRGSSSVPPVSSPNDSLSELRSTVTIPPELDGPTRKLDEAGDNNTIDLSETASTARRSSPFIFDDEHNTIWDLDDESSCSNIPTSESNSVQIIPQDAAHLHNPTKSDLGLVAINATSQVRASDDTQCSDGSAEIQHRPENLLDLDSFMVNLQMPVDQDSSNSIAVPRLDLESDREFVSSPPKIRGRNMVQSPTKDPSPGSEKSRHKKPSPRQSAVEKVGNPQNRKRRKQRPKIPAHFDEKIQVVETKERATEASQPGHLEHSSAGQEAAEMESGVATGNSKRGTKRKPTGQANESAKKEVIPKQVLDASPPQPNSSKILLDSPEAASKLNRDDDQGAGNNAGERSKTAFTKLFPVANEYNAAMRNSRPRMVGFEEDEGAGFDIRSSHQSPQADTKGKPGGPVSGSICISSSEMHSSDLSGSLSSAIKNYSGLEAAKSSQLSDSEKKEKDWDVTMTDRVSVDSLSERDVRARESVYHREGFQVSHPSQPVVDPGLVPRARRDNIHNHEGLQTLGKHPQGLVSHKHIPDGRRVSISEDGSPMRWHTAQPETPGGHRIKQPRAYHLPEVERHLGRKQQAKRVKRQLEFNAPLSSPRESQPENSGFALESSVQIVNPQIPAAPRHNRNRTAGAPAQSSPFRLAEVRRRLQENIRGSTGRARDRKVDGRGEASERNRVSGGATEPLSGPQPPRYSQSSGITQGMQATVDVGYHGRNLRVSSASNADMRQMMAQRLDNAGERVDKVIDAYEEGATRYVGRMGRRLDSERDKLAKQWATDSEQFKQTVQESKDVMERSITKNLKVTEDLERDQAHEDDTRGRSLTVLERICRQMGC